MADDRTSRYSDFDALMARHQRLIKGLCWWYAGGDADRVADLMQEVMAALWHWRHTLRPGATALQERAWVHIRCRSVFEHMRRRQQVETVAIEAVQDVAEEPPSGREQIDRLSADLSAAEQQLLELVLDGYTDGEIGETMRLAPGEAARMHAAVIEKMKQKARITE